VQKVSGTKISKFMNDPVNKLVRFVNIITDISQHFIDIYQSGNNQTGEKAMPKNKTRPRAGNKGPDC